ncbi:c-type cytochrome [Seonamhaeicola sediminis]|uniref:C-type cytochrome n=1 Tax=Seonamhaeicola sediminis TaxID=2528206 RepID=A0A562YFU6_9FLAO|nr:PQQ-dependent sugar dehydrogenase [Seonamhaeicola sediminis]TWO33231.1 c-type cytochrome [Seonamhaeicola sediminis]
MNSIKTVFKTRFFYILLLVVVLCNCKSEPKHEYSSTISINTEDIQNGKLIFEEKCSHCHNFKKDAIGPNLSGITKEVSEAWIKEFIKNPFKMISQKDPRAKALHQKYKTFMPEFSYLSEKEFDELLSYMNSYLKKEAPGNKNLEDVIDNPIKDTLVYSEAKAHIEFVAQVPASSKNGPLARINKMACTTNTERVFINDLRGMLYELKGDKPELYASISKYHDSFMPEPGLGTGFGSFAFHPDFSKNGLFYTAHSEKLHKAKADFSLPDSIPVKLQWVIKEWKSKDPKSSVFEGSIRELLRIDFVTIMHGIQEITFNPHSSKDDPDYGMLYIGVGDGGSVAYGFPKIALHDGAQVWGTILRIDPRGNNSDNGKYGVPKDNPFVNANNKKREVWVYGLRNPNRICWNAEGQMYASDIGHNIAEEVNIIEPGKFYGWPIREGRFLVDPNGNQSLAYPLPDNDADFGVTYPVIQYDHDDGSAISGGFFSNTATFKGKYIFGDIPEGTVYIADLSEANTDKRNIKKLNIVFKGKQTDFGQLTNKRRIDLRLGQDCDGNMYMFTKADGKIYRMINE